MTRSATEQDIPELVRLRALLFEDMGGDFFNPSSPDDWRQALATVFKQKLTEPDTLILVVDAETGLAACGIGSIEQWFPGPHSRNGRIGHVIGVVTDSAHRRRGHSRAIMAGLLDWFRDREAIRVDLYASHQAEPLYRELGFLDHPDPALYWRP
ncbi:GNAT family N-acetyltransferase [Herbidospora mongoliensis]|uniref:GNAT family N-acetyltransferase n=1 Tax=Herbidospora mongoliensis TaxID=688067 RepID=UPI000831CF88|nr:GNAT family N-acetyltransferase [Herbidospora mongoliensis]